MFDVFSVTRGCVSVLLAVIVGLTAASRPAFAQEAEPTETAPSPATALAKPSLATALAKPSPATALAKPSPATALDCLRTKDPASHLPPGTLSDPEGATDGCESSGRTFVCAPASGRDGADLFPEHGHLLDFDRVCTTASCGAVRSKTSVRLFERNSIQHRELHLSCMVLEEPDVDARPDNAPASHAQPVTCGDFTGEGSYSASDALGTLRSAVGSATCLICVCDVDNSGNIAATDALRTLRFAVGQPVTLDCPADGTPIAWDAGGDAINWTDPLNWSLDRIPNGCDAATIATGSVQHNMGSNMVRSVTSSVPLEFKGGTLTVRDHVTASGLTQMKGGTLARADVLVPGNDAPLVLTSSSGTLSDVHMSADMNLTASSAQVNITDGLVLDGTATLGTNAALYFPASSEVSLTGTGDVLMQHSNSYVFNYANTNLVIGQDILIHGSGGNVGGNQGNTAMTLQGTVDSDGAGTIDVGPPSGTWTSSGLLRASNGTLRLAGTWTNTGTLAVETAGTLVLGGNFTSAGFGGFDRDGGTVNVTGSFDIASGFTLDAGTGDWRLVGGTIRNGTLSSSDGAKIIYTSSAGTLSNVVMNAPMDMSASSAQVNVTNGLTLNAVATLGTNAAMYFPVSPLVSLNGNGAVLMQHSNSYVFNHANTHLMIGEDILIHGSGGNVGGNQGNTTMTTAATIDSDAGGTLDVGPPSGTWTNTGTLRASNGTLRTAGTWTSTGTMEVQPTGTLTLGGAFTSAGFGAFERDGGTVNLTGTFDITSGFTLDAGTGNWRLVGGTIKNGTLDAEDGARILYTSSGGTLSNVVMNADMDLTASSAQVNATNGLTLNGLATLGTNAALYFPVSPEVSLDGTGEVLMQHGNSYIFNYANTNLMIGSGILIHGSGGNVGGNQGN
ncbi:MAG TPA: hypothetical protein VEL28_22765, partial [Candidatus Binatia bacterium]|nr:hypothetical protein [Candidatus Binatia bacterium]